jgi:hypothetical protein
MPFKSTLAIEKQVIARVTIRDSDPRKDLLAEINDLVTSSTFTIEDLTYVLACVVAVSENVNEKDVKVKIKTDDLPF